MECKRCGKGSLSLTTVTLPGYYLVDLCVDCRNQWNQFITATEEYKYQNALEIDLKIALQEKDRDWALNIENEILENNRKLFELAQKWCEGKE